MNDARSATKHLAELLRREHSALGDFLIALADFDRERRWMELGHTNLFNFLHRELGVSKGSAFYRKTAAELIQRYPELAQSLRDGRLCITSVVELAKVITPENWREVVPRFFHASKAEAKAIAAELRPVEAPPQRNVVTIIPARARASAAGTSQHDLAPEPGVPVQPVEPAPNQPTFAVQVVEPAVVAVVPRRADGTASSAVPIDNAEPLTADLRRLHITVSKRFLAKLEAAQDALSHSHPDPDAEVVLEAALDLLLEKHARRKGLVKKPRSAPARPSDRPRHVPAEVKRAVWTRDQERCQYRLASDEICGSTRRLELDHVVPVARGGPSTIENLRITCAAHNQLAARQVFGDTWMNRYARGPDAPARAPGTDGCPPQATG